MRFNESVQLGRTILERSLSSPQANSCLVSVVIGDERGLVRLADWTVGVVPCARSVLDARFGPTGHATRLITDVRMVPETCELDRAGVLKGSVVVVEQRKHSCSLPIVLRALERAHVAAALVIGSRINHDDGRFKDLIIVSMTQTQVRSLVETYSTIKSGQGAFRVSVHHSRSHKVSRVALPMDATVGPLILIRGADDKTCVSDLDDHDTIYGWVEGLPVYEDRHKWQSFSVSGTGFSMLLGLLRQNIVKSRGLPPDDTLGVLGERALTASDRVLLRSYAMLFNTPEDVMSRISQIVEHAVVIGALCETDSNQGGLLPVTCGHTYTPGRTSDIVVISTMFKMGSMSFVNTLCPLLVEQKRFGLMILKTHHPAWFALLSRHLRGRSVRLRLLSIFGRESTSQYVSAFFQDITSPDGYGYTLPDGRTASRDDVLSTSIESLVSHYRKQRWEEIAWLNPHAYVRSAQVARDLSPSSVYFYEIRFDHLDEDAKKVFLELSLVPKTISRDNVGAEKWYGAIYKAFLERLRVDEVNASLASSVVSDFHVPDVTVTFTFEKGAFDRR